MRSSSRLVRYSPDSFGKFVCRNVQLIVSRDMDPYLLGVITNKLLKPRRVSSGSPPERGDHPDQRFGCERLRQPLVTVCLHKSNERGRPESTLHQEII